ncbi:MAG: RIP metalloprotease RseP [Holosporaceae bacterium]|jgi:regulator of sigma E protease|nr:RIP metalloprotease RseP [Holosporaceae bacterium]
MSILFCIISFFIIINVIVFVHEYGHFLAAKQTGVKVEKFSIGIGPDICGFYDRNGTRWCFSLFPIGGYVMMLGDGDISSSTEDEELLKDMSEEERKKSFTMKNNWEKMWIAFSGPLFNYIYAFVVLVGMCFFHGTPIYDPIIGEVMKESAAEKAGLAAGDKIISINGQEIKRYRDIILKLAEDDSRKFDFLVDRNGIQRTIEVYPEIKEAKKLMGGVKKTKMVGIRSGTPSFVRKGFFDSVKYALMECYSATTEMVGVFSKLFAGKKSLDDFGGVVRVAEVAGDLSKTGNFALLIMFTVTLSLNLGFINLFPLPVLDGGRIFLSFIEQITRKKLNKKVQEYIMMACAILLIFLMLITTVNDVLRLEIVNRYVSKFFG